MGDRNTSHLAGEFLVAGELSRRGYPVSITMGNAKSVDIYVETGEHDEKGNRRVVKVDAKAGRAKGNFPIAEESVDKDLYYIFVYLQSQHPEYFVVRGEEILDKRRELINKWGKREGIRYKTLNTNDYLERWDKLPKPPREG
jgi:hypothetical protein